MKEVIQKNQLEATQGGYELSRLNALRHGVLSRLPVLPWESREEYDAVHLALVEEYIPVGATEEHLVEEITGIIWRKRRLRMAETAAFRKKFRTLITYDSKDIVGSGLMGVRKVSTGGYQSMVDIFKMDPEEVSQEVRDAAEALRCAGKAREIIESESPEAYQQALEALLSGTREWWEEQVEEEEYTPSSDGLLEFLENEVIPYFSQRLVVLSNHGSIMAQAHGEALDISRLDNLSRYETFLDRKLERILAMLLKLKALRQEQEPDAE